MPPASATAPGCGSEPLLATAASSDFVFSFASETFGSSNGLMPSPAPAMAVANSQRKNSAPRPAMRVLRRSTGWPAASRASSRSASGASRSVEIATKARSLPYSSGAPERFVDDRQRTLAVLAGALRDELFDPETERGERRRQRQRQLVASLASPRRR